ncbi:protein STICHEL-like [Bidens hawaiensis]|uniref:protein STICHEL-like n=1 Tax=Bidens hawaiensis TaxID=980011 RepID=UPI00404A9F0E
MSSAAANQRTSSLVDPSNLHLKKELIKAARALRDPGTTSSCHSPLLTSSRSVTLPPTAAGDDSVNSHYNHIYINNNFAAGETESSHCNASATGSNNNNNNNNRRKEKKVFLYNWRTQRSDSERRSNADEGIGDGEESVDDTLSDAQIGTIDDDRRALSSTSKMFNRPMQPIRAKRKSKNVRHSAAALKMLADRYDDANSDDLVLKGGSVTSPLLSRFGLDKLKRDNSRRDDSSYCYSTPALSTSSINNKYWVGSWDGMTGSLNNGMDGDDDDEDDDNDDDQLGLPGRHGCGIPCYWSSSKKSTPKRGVCGSGSCYSPSFSDTLRRKGTSLLCGSQTNHHRRHHSLTTGGYNKKRHTHVRKTSHVPLLTNGDESRDRSSIGTDDELDLEALSRLDGRRWSTSYNSQQGLELVAVNQETEGDSPSSLVDNINCFSYKYKPMFFEDIVDQNVVVLSLVNSIIRGRVAPIYLFQGPRGTGKTSTARVFAAALNCLTAGDMKPCGVCTECDGFISGKSRVITEMDGSSKTGIDKVRFLMKKLQMGGSSSTFIRHDVYVIDECHLLPSKLWLAFQKFLEEPPIGVVFIFITTDLDNVPRAVLSRCQKYLFNKIKDSEIVNKLKRISEEENLDVEEDALDLIALNVEGSLRDAETMLDQLSLLGKRITTDLVNELVGVVSDEKLLKLLELAMSSKTAETVKKARELMELGVDPMVLMSQMATLIMDIIAGTYQVVEAGYGDSFFDGRSLTETEVERLKQALKLLSESEKQLRVSSERSTWFTATLLQLGCVPSSDPTPLGSGRRQSSRTTDDDMSATFKDIYFQKQKVDTQHYEPQKSTPLKPNHTSSSNSLEDAVLPMRQLINGDDLSVSRHDDVINSSLLDDIWARCIDKCHSKTLRQLLHTHGNLVSVSEDEGVLVAYIVFRDKDIKSRAERFVSSITNSFEIVLRRNTEVRILLLTDDKPNNGEPTTGLTQRKTTSMEKCSNQEPSKGRNPVQRIESIIHEQRLETAWLQTAEKGTPGSLQRLKPERNQVLPQDGGSSGQMESTQQQWEDELTRELNLLKINGGKPVSKEPIAMSPSVNNGYESGSARGGCLCWNKPPRHNRRRKVNS